LIPRVSQSQRVAQTNDAAATICQRIVDDSWSKVSRDTDAFAAVVSATAMRPEFLALSPACGLLALSAPTFASNAYSLSLPPGHLQGECFANTGCTESESLRERQQGDRNKCVLLNPRERRKEGGSCSQC